MDKTAKDRMKRYRNKKRNDSVMESPESVTEEMKSVTADVTPLPVLMNHFVTPEHPVMKYLIPGEKRKKMELIVESAKRQNQLPHIYLGCGSYSLPLDIVGEMLECTQ